MKSCAHAAGSRRNHNFIASKLFGINERGKFKPVSSLDAAGIKAQDEELFQTARLINAGFFVNVVFYDYSESFQARSHCVILITISSSVRYAARNAWNAHH